MEDKMTWLPANWAHESAPSTASNRISLRIVGTVLRTVFIVAVLMVTIQVALPQSETVWTAYETPADLFRMALGLLVSIWILFQLFSLPKDEQAYRTWSWLGLAAVPFAVICALAMWGFFQA